MCRRPALATIRPGRSAHPAAREIGGVLRRRPIEQGRNTARAPMNDRGRTPSCRGDSVAGQRRSNAMSHSLYRLGRFAARRPWVVIGAWLVAAGLVVAASGTVGRDLEDSFEGARARLPGRHRPADGRPVGHGRTDRPGGRGTARRQRDLLRLDCREGRAGRGPGGGRRPAQGARHERPGGCAGRGGRGGGGERVGLARRPGRSRPRPVSGDRGTGPRRSGTPQRARRRGPHRFAAADRDGRRPVLRLRGGADRRLAS